MHKSTLELQLKSLTFSAEMAMIHRIHAKQWLKRYRETGCNIHREWFRDEMRNRRRYKRQVAEKTADIVNNV